MSARYVINIPPGKFVAITAGKVPIAQLNYLILKHLVGEMKAYLLYISVGKPHNYMSHLLAIHGVPQRGITYVDVEKSTELRFPLRLQDSNVKARGFLRRDFVAVQDYEYIIIDNIDHLAHLWTPEKITGLLRSLRESASQHGVGVILPVKSTESDVCREALSLCDQVITLEVREDED